MAQYVSLLMTVINFLILDAGSLNPHKAQGVVSCIVCKLYLNKVERKNYGGEVDPEPKITLCLFVSFCKSQG